MLPRTGPKGAETGKSLQGEERKLLSLLLHEDRWVPITEGAVAAVKEKGWEGPHGGS